ncbi:MAG TPA: AMP-binding protein, partial [Candidatus Cybelea sp.]|nr:AMP-binding protein [Candidatus Cybelea sp.]
AGYAMLLPFLEKDRTLAKAFFAELKLIFYAGAALPQDLWDRLEALSIAVLGHRVVMTSSWGSTETAPLATAAHFPLERAGVIGLPVPGVAIKLVPSGGKMEIRVKGPNVTPGYLKRPDLTAEAFDAEGYYRIGDAGRFADANDPAQGIVFDGRTAEDFKLATGTWVHVGAVRVGVLAAASPVLQDAVVCGHDGPEIGILAWPNVNACKSICTHAEHRDDAAHLVRCASVLDHIRRGIGAYNAENSASSSRIARMHVMAEPPSIDANEITDKGYINQRATLERRQGVATRLFAEAPGDDVIVFA